MSETVNQETKTSNPETEQKTFSQDELNAIVNDRLKREREKYAGFDALKEKAERLDQLEEASKSEIQKMTEKADRLQAELDDIKRAEGIRQIRAKVAKETGIPENLLTGETEEDCTAQAEAIKAFAKPTYPQIRDAGEIGGAVSTSTAQQFADWFNNH